MTDHLEFFTRTFTRNNIRSSELEGIIKLIEESLLTQKKETSYWQNLCYKMNECISSLEANDITLSPNYGKKKFTNISTPIRLISIKGEDYNNLFKHSNTPEVIALALADEVEHGTNNFPELENLPELSQLFENLEVDSQ